MTRAAATIATTMPAITPPDKDLDAVDCELVEIELELDGTLPKILLVTSALVSAGVLEMAVLAEVERGLEVEAGDETCEPEST